MMPGIVSAVVRAACAFSLLTLAGHIPLPPDAGAPTGVKGSLDKEIIRRVIRSHIKRCCPATRQQLTSNPTLAAR